MGPIARTETYGEYIQVRSGDIHIPKIQAVEPLRLVCQEFVDAIRSGEPPIADGDAGATVVEVLEGMSESMRSAGAPVRLDQGAPA